MQWDFQLIIFSTYEPAFMSVRHTLLNGKDVQTMIADEKNAYIHGDVCLRKQRRKRQKLLITDLLLDYAKNSTLHGLRYVAEKGLTTVEKLFWIVTFTGSIILCSLLIKNVYVKWRTSPVIVTVSERQVSVGEIPFPSVTICPQIKSKATVYNLSREMDKITNDNSTEIREEDKNMFSDISMLCGLPLDITNRLYTNSSIIDHINDVSPNLDDITMLCSWHGEVSECSNFFQKVYTAEGICYNINGLSASEMFRDTVQSDYAYSERNIAINGWTIEKGYSEAEIDTFPAQASENGAFPDLAVILRNNVEYSDGFCNGMNSGFKIYMQHPTDHPQSSLYYYAALDEQLSSLAVSAEILSSDPTLEDNYSAEVRQCYFQDDRQLRYFKIYTASNCRLECLSNYTYEQCGCVGYYMPHDNSSEICAEGKEGCMKDAQNNLSRHELKLKINKSSDGCQCLSACNSVEYNAEILKTGFHFKTFAKKLFESYGSSFEEFYGNTSMFSKVDIYFKKPQYVSMRRSELFGLTDFVANIGGLLGVFLGFSFLSVIELFYFMTLRLGCTIKIDLKEEKNRINSVKVKKEFEEPVTIINITE